MYYLKITSIQCDEGRLYFIRSDLEFSKRIIVIRLNARRIE